jgi:hypothetical protein
MASGPYSLTIEEGHVDLTRHSYSSVLTDLDVDVPPPDYGLALEWMKAFSNPQISYDIWARGNYARRIIDLRKRNAKPLLIPVKTVAEMQWAYRRTALLGLPVEFVYVGGLQPTAKILHLFPDNGDLLIGGCGYVASLGSMSTIKGRKWFPVLGYSQLMPAPFMHWLANEAATEFRQGDVFVSAAEHVGIDPANRDHGTEAVAGLNGGMSFGPVERQAELLSAIELPSLDKMRPKDFSKFLKNHENELVRFRHAFAKLGSMEPGDDFEDVLAEIRYEVAELCMSDSCSSVRDTALKLGGSIGLSAAVVGSVLASPSISVATAAVVGVGTAASILEKLYEHHVSSGLDRRRNPYYVGFKLGMDKVAAIPKRLTTRKFANLLRQERGRDATGLSDLHWLTGVDDGMKFLAVREARNR